MPRCGVLVVRLLTPSPSVAAERRVETWNTTCSRPHRMSDGAQSQMNSISASMRWLIRTCAAARECPAFGLQLELLLGVLFDNDLRFTTLEVERLVEWLDALPRGAARSEALLAFVEHVTRTDMDHARDSTQCGEATVCRFTTRPDVQRTPG